MTFAEEFGEIIVFLFRNHKNYSYLPINIRRRVGNSGSPNVPNVRNVPPIKTASAGRQSNIDDALVFLINFVSWHGSRSDLYTYV